MVGKQGQQATMVKRQQQAVLRRTGQTPEPQKPIPSRNLNNAPDPFPARQPHYHAQKTSARKLPSKPVSDVIQELKRKSMPTSLSKRNSATMDLMKRQLVREKSCRELQLLKRASSVSCACDMTLNDADKQYLKTQLSIWLPCVLKRPSLSDLEAAIAQMGSRILRNVSKFQLLDYNAQLSMSKAQRNFFRRCHRNQRKSRHPLYYPLFFHSRPGSVSDVSANVKGDGELLVAKKTQEETSDDRKDWRHALMKEDEEVPWPVSERNTGQLDSSRQRALPGIKKMIVLPDWFFRVLEDDAFIDIAPAGTELVPNFLELEDMVTFPRRLAVRNIPLCHSGGDGVNLVTFVEQRSQVQVTSPNAISQKSCDATLPKIDTSVINVTHQRKSSTEITSKPSLVSVSHSVKDSLEAESNETEEDHDTVDDLFPLERCISFRHHWKTAAGDMNTKSNTQFSFKRSKIVDQIFRKRNRKQDKASTVETDENRSGPVNQPNAHNLENIKTTSVKKGEQVGNSSDFCPYSDAEIKTSAGCFNRSWNNLIQTDNSFSAGDSCSGKTDNTLEERQRKRASKASKVGSSRRKDRGQRVAGDGASGRITQPAVSEQPQLQPPDTQANRRFVRFVDECPSDLPKVTDRSNSSLHGNENVIEYSGKYLLDDVAGSQEFLTEATPIRNVYLVHRKDSEEVTCHKSDMSFLRGLVDQKKDPPDPKENLLHDPARQALTDFIREQWRSGSRTDQVDDLPARGDTGELHSQVLSPTCEEISCDSSPDSLRREIGELYADIMQRYKKDILGQDFKSRYLKNKRHKNSSNPKYANKDLRSPTEIINVYTANVNTQESQSDSEQNEVSKCQVTSTNEDMSPTITRLFNRYLNPVVVQEPVAVKDEIENMIPQAIKSLDKMLPQPIKSLDKMLQQPIKSLDKMLQQPIKSLDKVLPQPIKSLDKMLQQPIKSLDTMLQQPIKSLDKMLPQPTTSLGTAEILCLFDQILDSYAKLDCESDGNLPESRTYTFNSSGWRVEPGPQAVEQDDAMLKDPHGCLQPLADVSKTRAKMYVFPQKEAASLDKNWDDLGLPGFYPVLRFDETDETQNRQYSDTEESEGPPPLKKLASEFAQGSHPANAMDSIDEAAVSDLDQMKRAPNREQEPKQPSNVSSEKSNQNYLSNPQSAINESASNRHEFQTSKLSTANPVEPAHSNPHAPGQQTPTYNTPYDHDIQSGLHSPRFSRMSFGMQTSRYNHPEAGTSYSKQISPRHSLHDASTMFSCSKFRADDVDMQYTPNLCRTPSLICADLKSRQICFDPCEKLTSPRPECYTSKLLSQCNPFSCSPCRKSQATFPRPRLRCDIKQDRGSYCRRPETVKTCFKRNVCCDRLQSAKTSGYSPYERRSCEYFHSPTSKRLSAADSFIHSEAAESKKELDSASKMDETLGRKLCEIQRETLAYISQVLSTWQDDCRCRRNPTDDAVTSVLRDLPRACRSRNYDKPRISKTTLDVSPNPPYPSPPCESRKQFPCTFDDMCSPRRKPSSRQWKVTKGCQAEMDSLKKSPNPCQQGVAHSAIQTCACLSKPDGLCLCGTLSDRPKCSVKLVCRKEVDPCLGYQSSRELRKTSDRYVKSSCPCAQDNEPSEKVTCPCAKGKPYEKATYQSNKDNEDRDKTNCPCAKSNELYDKATYQSNETSEPYKKSTCPCAKDNKPYDRSTYLSNKGHDLFEKTTCPCLKANERQERIVYPSIKPCEPHAKTTCPCEKMTPKVTKINKKCQIGNAGLRTGEPIFTNGKTLGKIICRKQVDDCGRSATECWTTDVCEDSELTPTSSATAEPPSNKRDAGYRDTASDTIAEISTFQSDCKMCKKSPVTKFSEPSTSCFPTQPNCALCEPRDSCSDFNILQVDKFNKIIAKSRRPIVHIRYKAKKMTKSPSCTNIGTYKKECTEKSMKNLAEELKVKIEEIITKSKILQKEANKVKRGQTSCTPKNETGNESQTSYSCYQIELNDSLDELKKKLSNICSKHCLNTEKKKPDYNCNNSGAYMTKPFIEKTIPQVFFNVCSSVKSYQPQNNTYDEAKSDLSNQDLTQKPNVPNGIPEAVAPAPVKESTAAVEQDQGWNALPPPERGAANDRLVQKQVIRSSRFGRHFLTKTPPEAAPAYRPSTRNNEMCSRLRQDIASSSTNDTSRGLRGEHSSASSCSTKRRFHTRKSCARLETRHLECIHEGVEPSPSHSSVSEQTRRDECDDIYTTRLPNHTHPQVYKHRSVERKYNETPHRRRCSENPFQPRSSEAAGDARYNETLPSRNKGTHIEPNGTFVKTEENHPGGSYRRRTNSADRHVDNPAPPRYADVPGYIGTNLTPEYFGNTPGGVVGPGAIRASLTPECFGTTLTPYYFGAALTPGVIGTNLTTGRLGINLTPGGLGSTLTPGGFGPTIITGGLGPTLIPGGLSNNIAPGTLGANIAPGDLDTNLAHGSLAATLLPGSLVSTLTPGGLGNTQTPGGLVPTLIPGGLSNTQNPGGLVPTLIPGGLSNTQTPGGLVPTLIPGSLVPTFIPGGLSNTQNPGGLVTTQTHEGLGNTLTHVPTLIPGGLGNTLTSGALVPTIIPGSLVPTLTPEYFGATPMPGYFGTPLTPEYFASRKTTKHIDALAESKVNTTPIIPTTTTTTNHDIGHIQALTNGSVAQYLTPWSGMRCLFDGHSQTPAKSFFPTRLSFDDQAGLQKLYQTPFAVQYSAGLEKGDSGESSSRHYSGNGGSYYWQNEIKRPRHTTIIEDYSNALSSSTTNRNESTAKINTKSCQINLSKESRLDQKNKINTSSCVDGDDFSKPTSVTKTLRKAAAEVVKTQDVYIQAPFSRDNVVSRTFTIHPKETKKKRTTNNRSRKTVTKKKPPRGVKHSNLTVNSDASSHGIEDLPFDSTKSNATDNSSFSVEIRLENDSSCLSQNKSFIGRTLHWLRTRLASSRRAGDFKQVAKQESKCRLSHDAASNRDMTPRDKKSPTLSCIAEPELLQKDLIQWWNSPACLQERKILQKMVSTKCPALGARSNIHLPAHSSRRTTRSCFSDHVRERSHAFDNTRESKLTNRGLNVFNSKTNLIRPYSSPAKFNSGDVDNRKNVSKTGSESETINPQGYKMEEVCGSGESVERKPLPVVVTHHEGSAGLAASLIDVRKGEKKEPETWTNALISCAEITDASDDRVVMEGAFYLPVAGDIVYTKPRVLPFRLVLFKADQRGPRIKIGGSYFRHLQTHESFFKWNVNMDLQVPTQRRSL